MPLALRALGAAALAVSQAGLTVTENGTYLTTVTLDSVPVNLLVDTLTSGLWVKCTAIEGPACIATGSSNIKRRLDRYDTSVPRKIKRFMEVKIAGQVFNGFDGNVIYDALPKADASVQGILGLKRTSANFEAASMYLDGQVTTVALQLGATSTDSKISLDSVDQSALTRKGLQTAASVDDTLDCFEVPFANGTAVGCPLSSSPSSPTTSYRKVAYDPGLPYIGLSSTDLDTFERRFLFTCEKIASGYDTTGYTCDASIKLPRLTVQINWWAFYLDASDYTTPIKDSSRVKVLVGEYPYGYSGMVFGVPFLRKYPLVYNSTGYSTLYCTENTTCTRIQRTRTPLAPYYGASGVGGNTNGGGGGGSSPSYEIDVETKRKRKKLYLTIGLSVGGVVFLAICGCLCKCCKSEDKNDSNDDTTKTQESEKMELTVGVAIGVGDDSDSDNDREVVNKSKAKGGKTGSANTSAAAVKRKEKDADSDSDDSDLSSSYDSESSEDRRRERRRRRRRRRERRRERELRRQSEMTTTTTATVNDETDDTPYVAASSPKNRA